ncbi:MAG TPA: excinuclease ABC subunit UvrA [bacterium]|nr:excinuclease ABC subunit UvrA [bacterium]
MTASSIEIRGAREHNLKNLNLKIPRNQLVVITGLSGSGKSSLAFDTIYAEGQRRYLESLSSYARQFLEKLKKPEVDYISGLSPSIAIEQHAVTHNPRSTVATVTELYDYLRLLYAKAGDPYCFKCGTMLSSQTLDEILREILKHYAKSEIQIFAPMVRGRKGEFQKLFQEVLKKGYSRARIDGAIKPLKPDLKLRKTQRHDIEILIDHLKVNSGKTHLLMPSLTAAVNLSGGTLAVLPVSKPSGKKEVHFFSTKRSCPKCQTGFPDLTPNMFSFNSPYGACPRCKGLGKLSQVVSGGVIRDEGKPLMSGALNEEIFFSFNKYFIEDLLYDLTKKYHFDWSLPYKDWPGESKEAFFWGDNELSGLIEELERLFHETSSEEIRRKVRKFLREDVCRECGGKRLRKESLGVKIQGKNIVEMTEQSVESAVPFFGRIRFPEKKKPVTETILKEIRERLGFLLNVGLGYLTLDRTVATLAGGELQRIRLAAQIGVGLTGVLYVLDEPSIGLHPRDNTKLLDTLEKLRDLKNTVLVVEHDEETMRRADYLIDLGPGAGREGGQVVAEGPPSEFQRSENRSLTAKYLSGHLTVNVPRRKKNYKNAPFLWLKGAREHNLKNVDVKIPLGLFVCVTGVSGSGKSTLVHDILYRELHNRIWKTQYRVGQFRSLTGAEKIDQVIEIDQSPIGRTPRSNPATYTDLFTPVRKLFSQIQESRVRHYTPSRFSFNLKGGRCETCRGEGAEKLQMSFMPDLYVVCENCRGERYNEQTLEVRYGGKNIAEVLDLSVKEAVEFFSNFSVIREKLELLETIGLGYVKLGQPSTTLSGGEAQRIKLATELSKKSTGNTLYLLDEPTTGLHFADIQNLLKALFRLRDQGNTILIIEHHLDVIKMADYIIDLGPEGGDFGGELIASGTPDEIVRTKKSYTGRFLKKVLNFE